MTEASETAATVPEGGPSTFAPSNATSASISTVSRIAVQETISEISATARQTRAASAIAWRWIRLGTEKKLGIEVNIDDPALRELFGHLLQVEGLLGQVRSHGESLMQGASLLAEGPSNAGTGLAGMAGGTAGASAVSAVGSGAQAATLLAESLTVLASRAGDRLAQSTASDTPVGSSTEGGSAGSTAVPVGRLCGDAPAIVGNAVWHTVSMSPNASDSGSARYRMERRLSEEVFEPVEKQMQEFESLRDRVRERQGWRQQLEHAQREVAKLQKMKRSPLAAGIADKVGEVVGGLAGAASAAVAAGAGSGLRPLVTGTARIGAADEQLKEAQEKVAALDEEVFNRLLEIKNDAHYIVARLWVALARIRTEFFASLAGNWAPVATALRYEGHGAGSSAAAKPNGEPPGDAAAADAAPRTEPAEPEVPSADHEQQVTDSETARHVEGADTSAAPPPQEDAAESAAQVFQPPARVDPDFEKGPHAGAATARAEVDLGAEEPASVPRFNGLPLEEESKDVPVASTEGTAGTNDELSRPAQEPKSDLQPPDELKSEDTPIKSLGTEQSPVSPVSPVSGADEEF